MRLTDNNRNWGFGLSFLYLRNVRRFAWNHKHVYRIYRVLELNLRIKPRKRLALRSTLFVDAARDPSTHTDHGLARQAAGDPL